jgi:head-tail adaptor
MNPGLLNLRIRLERKVTATDSLGQPFESWVTVGRCRARGMMEKDRGEAMIGDRPTEQRGKVFQVRSRPFLDFYRAGDRLVEEARTEWPETTWQVPGWTELTGTRGMFLEITAHSPESREPVAAIEQPSSSPSMIDGGDADDLPDAEIEGGGA